MVGNMSVKVYGWQTFTILKCLESLVIAFLKECTVLPCNFLPLSHKRLVLSSWTDTNLDVQVCECDN